MIFNKYVETKSIDIFSKKKPDEVSILKLIYHFEWLATVKKVLIAFYEKTESDFKIERNGIKWFDGLDVWEVNIVITEEGIMETDLFIQDYYNHHSGFCLSLKDDIITDLEYDPIL